MKAPDDICAALRLNNSVMVSNLHLKWSFVEEELVLAVSGRLELLSSSKQGQQLGTFPNTVESEMEMFL